MSKIKLTHQQCVYIASIWLSNRTAMSDYRCKVILQEMVGYQSMLIDSELPDVLGVWSNTLSVNIECKISRSDFLADKNKKHNHPIGNYKFYACPHGLITEDELPKNYGLIYVNGRGGTLIKRPTRVEVTQDITSMLADVIINGCNAGILKSEHKKRHNGMWNGKAVIL